MNFLVIRRHAPDYGLCAFSTQVVPRRGRRLLIAAILAASFPAIAAALPQAANPDARVPPTTYRPVITDYMPFRPIEPRSWQGVNQEVAPKPREESSTIDSGK